MRQGLWRLVVCDYQDLFQNIAGQTSERLKFIVSKLATAPDLPASDFHIMPPCRALEPWATPNHTLPLVSSLAFPSGVAASPY